MRLTDLPGISRGLSRTRHGALQALQRYEDANADLAAPVRRLLGLAALGRYFGRKILEDAMGCTLPKAPFRDWSWRWWNVLVASGLEEYWDQFAKHAQHGGVREAALFLRTCISETSYHLFLRRAGTNPHNDHRPKRNSVIWTKGGCWRVESPFTQILVLHRHLPHRPLNNLWQRALGHERIRLIERELMNSVKPDAIPRGDAIQQAISYVRWRIPNMMHHKHKRAAPHAAAWFFQTAVPDPRGLVEPRGKSYFVLGPKTRAVLLAKWQP